MPELNPYASPQAVESGELIRAECPSGFIWSGFVDRYQFQVAPSDTLSQRIVDFYKGVGFHRTSHAPGLHFRRGHLWGSLIGAESRARQTLCVELTPRSQTVVLVTLQYDVDFYFAIRYKPQWTLSPFREAVRLARTLDALNWE
ncbi:hypothetical protein LOC68_15405 [Blastopirellula sp. JC732]|uniref:Uncharacterized protein n=1 Tax=Blastopirellula sediminis TaxID=2894196 RepID=A0A9X1MNF6_9BACT|nr:hypothetical protein [Blastopirellula sediminis]MCC9606929.1 hypothetical protein [Blastopirellula sediminis]MCC9629776.1 hypothetical protein [Blastopirellula sediminis]